MKLPYHSWSGDYKNQSFGLNVKYNSLSKKYYITEYRIRGERSNVTDYKSLPNEEFDDKDDADKRLLELLRNNINE